jgi:hypothetical protein
MIQTLSTALSAFYAGETYEVIDATGAAWIRAGVAVKTDVPPEWILAFMRRLEIGKGQPCLFLPNLGEFGHKILTGIRYFHFHQASEKVVCCFPSERVLYPSATEYFTDWQEPPHVFDAMRGGSGHSPVSLWPKIVARFPNHVPIVQGGFSFSEEMLPIHPDERIPFRPKIRGLRADVCISVRNRRYCPVRNWQHYQQLADAIRAAGHTFAVIGHRDTSHDLDGQTCHSGDYDTDAAIELFQNCDLFIGTDSGPSHLASTVGSQMLLFREIASGTRDFFPRMGKVNPGRIDVVSDGWENPEAVIDRALQLLSQRREIVAA